MTHRSLLTALITGAIVACTHYYAMAATQYHKFCKAGTFCNFDPCFDMEENDPCFRCTTYERRNWDCETQVNQMCDDEDDIPAGCGFLIEGNCTAQLICSGSSSKLCPQLYCNAIAP